MPSPDLPAPRLSAPGPSAAEGDSNGTIASADAEQKGEFFSMFYLPSSHSYDEDVHLATSSSSAPFQGAATAVMGGILSVLDTALAVLNEEFDNPSDSIISESTKDDGEECQGSNDSCVSKSNVLGWCKRSSRSKLSKSASKSENSSTKNEDKASDNLEQSTEHGTISTLQLYEEGSGDIMKALISDRHLKSRNSMDIERHAGTVPEFKIMKKEDSDYCIIRNESETNDGWLVVDG